MVVVVVVAWSLREGRLRAKLAVEGWEVDDKYRERLHRQHIFL
jgi:hypothetical protein